MKKLSVLSVLFALLLAGCSSAPSGADSLYTGGSRQLGAGSNVSSSSAASDTAGEEDMVVISERLFIAQTNNIYINPEDYLGKTIKCEGLFKTYFIEETGMTYYYIIRYGPGCCAYDGEAGFEVSWDGEWPEENDWTEAVGVLEAYEENGIKYLRLRLSSLTILDERGAENVST